MLPTPDTSHVAYERVYEPAEDSFLLLDTLSSPSETSFLRNRFCPPSPSAGASTPEEIPVPVPAPTPLVVEIGTGSGVVVAFLTAHAGHVFGTRHVLTAGVDVNVHACGATTETVRKAIWESASSTQENDGGSRDALRGKAESTHLAPGVGDGGGSGTYLGSLQADLTAPLRSGSVDILVFNPPYVPTDELPDISSLELRLPSGIEHEDGTETTGTQSSARPRSSSSSGFGRDSHLLSLSYAGGRDGMETTDRLIESLPRVLSERGTAYILLCAQNKPDEVKARIRTLSTDPLRARSLAQGHEAGGSVTSDARWNVATVGSSGKKAGWERLQIIRVWRGG